MPYALRLGLVVYSLKFIGANTHSFDSFVVILWESGHIARLTRYAFLAGVRTKHGSIFDETQNSEVTHASNVLHLTMNFGKMIHICWKFRTRFFLSFLFGFVLSCQFISDFQAANQTWIWLRYYFQTLKKISSQTKG